MKTIKKTFTFGAALFAAVAAFGQYTVLVDSTNKVIFPTNIVFNPPLGTNSLPGILSRLSIRDGTLLTNITAVSTNIDATTLSGIVSTNNLPGALGTLSTWNGGGALTNAGATTWFTNANTTNNYNLPDGRNWFRLSGVSSGGAGASGRRGPLGTVCSGGGGGAGANFSQKTFHRSEFWTTNLTIFIPAVALGGGAVTVDGTDGTNGESAGAIIVHVSSTRNNTNIVMSISGGGGGVGGDSNGSAGGTSGVQGIGLGTAGGDSSNTGGVGGIGGTASNTQGAAGGGSGGGINTGGSPSAGGNSGRQSSWFGTTSSVISGGAVNGGAITAYFSTTAYPKFLSSVIGWYGAAGSGGSTNGAAAAGQSALGYGAGGGGGGGSLDGINSGDGGAGGPPIFVIEAW